MIPEACRRARALACDYDGTIARDGRVPAAVVHALERFRGSGRRSILVTGREIADLAAVFPRVDLFDVVVGENGGVLFEPSSGRTAALADPPPAALVDELQRRGVHPLSVGRVILATRDVHQAAVSDALRALGVDRNVILNKGAVMLLPPGIDKASGLSAAVARLALSLSDVVGVGDAENDLALMRVCRCAVAVGNALRAVQAEADYVTRGEDGEGFAELVDLMLTA